MKSNKSEDEKAMRVFDLLGLAKYEGGRWIATPKMTGLANQSPELMREVPSIRVDDGPRHAGNARRSLLNAGSARWEASRLERCCGPNSCSTVFTPNESPASAVYATAPSGSLWSHKLAHRMGPPPGSG